MNRIPKNGVRFFCHDGQGNYLFHRRGAACRDNAGKWCPGAGGVERDESLHEALKREIMEEYGVVPLEIEYLDHCLHLSGEDDAFSIYSYRVRVDPNLVTVGEPDMNDGNDWFRLSCLPALEDMHDGMKEVMERGNLLHAENQATINENIRGLEELIASFPPET